MTYEEAIEYATAVVEQWKDWVSENSEQYQFYKLSLEILEKVRDGKMIELPCNVGDIITALWDVPTTSKYVPYLAEVKEFRQSKRNGEVVCTVSIEPIEYRGRRKEYRVNEFGKLLFFSYDEAEKALKEIEK